MIKPSELVRNPWFVGQTFACAIILKAPDAAGKGGAIRRHQWMLATDRPSGLRPQRKRSLGFWRHLPENHATTSRYGRVLVERVEGFCTETDCLRAYAEIDDWSIRWRVQGAIIH